MAKTSNISSTSTDIPNPTSDGQHILQPQKQIRIVSVWENLSINTPIFKTMLKGALPPSIAIAMYQSDSISRRYTTLGYLIAVVAILSMCTLPRMKFLQTLLLNILGTCLACAMAFLGLVLSTRARSHSEARLSMGYNSSASVVCAIFLFVNVYGVNTMRARFPALQFPAILYSIYLAVCFTDMPLFDMSRGSAFIWHMTETFLTGFALAAGVSLVIFPLSSRAIMFRSLAATLGSLRLAVHPRIGLHDNAHVEKENADEGKQQAIRLNNNNPAVARTATLCQNFSKLLIDMASGKLEVAWGIIDAGDIDRLAGLLRALMIPTIGLGLRGEVFRELAEPTVHLLQEISQMGELMNAALDHVSVRFGLIPLPGQNRLRTPEDVENASASDEIGLPEFAMIFKERLDNFRAGRERRITTWTKENREDLEVQKTVTEVSLHTREQFAQQQLYLLLYIEHLMESSANSALDLIKFADQKGNTKNHLIFPSDPIQTYWQHLLHGSEDPEHTVNRTVRRPDQEDRSTEGYFVPIDMEIEHLPPETMWERQSNHLRTVGHVLRSPESVFGLRVTLATVSIGIAAFLEPSQVFFQKNRLVWALVMSTIGMSWTSGQSVFGLLVRVLGTLIASILSFVIWYIVDGKTGGVIFFLFFFTFVEFYFVIKYPRYIVVSVITMVTQFLIVGYDLQVRKIGKKVAEASGQPYYPVYVLAPYRLACVIGGCLVAFIWTIFPYPITDRSQLRKDLGSSIYMLAKYYACVHAGIVARYQGTEGDPNSPTSYGNLLAKSESQISTEELALLGGLAQKAEFTHWEVKVGGKFPRKRFDDVIQDAQSLMNNLALMAHITQTLPRDSTVPWFRNLSRLLKEINPTSHDVVTTLVLLSASVTNGNALPPYLQAPAYFEVSRQLMAMDSEILSMKHVSEEGYAAYATLQVAITLVSADLEKLIENVKKLVGEVKFRFNTGDEESG